LESEPTHDPVLVAEVIEHLRPERGGLFVDATVGLGGHARVLAEAGADRLIGIDRDEAALEHARTRLAQFADRVELVHSDYRDIEPLLASRGLTSVRGILADLGVSSMQVDDPSRGFSFRQPGPLDMRADRSRGETLAERLADVDEATLADVVWRFGEERHARRVARAILRSRDEGRLTDTGALASVVRRAAGGGSWTRIDPATRTFQALRIWVNDELTGLEQFLDGAIAVLAPGGRLAVIAFHSLEDRIVKHRFRERAAAGDVSRVTRRPVGPGEDEIQRNPRARSAKLRVVEKMA
jgi:16S rRNA (cytosine1402-N4)-methyltransferase